MYLSLSLFTSLLLKSNNNTTVQGIIYAKLLFVYEIVRTDVATAMVVA